MEDGNNPHIITKSKAKDNTTARDSKQPCSLGNHSLPPTNLASMAWHSRCTGWSFCQLTFAGIGAPGIWQSLWPLLSSSLELPGFGQRLTAGGTLKSFQTFGLMVGRLACYNVLLIYFFPLTWYILRWFVIVFQNRGKNIFWPAIKGVLI